MLHTSDNKGPWRVWQGMLIAACLLSLTACGGAGVATDAQAAQPTQPVTTGTGITTDNPTPALVGLPGLDGLDVIPLAFGQQGTGQSGPGRGTQAFLPYAAYALQASPRALLAAGTGVTLPAPQGRPEYVIYALPAVQAGAKLQQVELARGAGAGPGLVAYADFARGRWVMLTPQADGSFAPPAGGAGLASPGGRAYVAVLAWPQAMTINSVALRLAD
jgi:hypothetical protein